MEKEDENPIIVSENSGKEKEDEDPITAWEKLGNWTIYENQDEDPNNLLVTCGVTGKPKPLWDIIGKSFMEFIDRERSLRKPQLEDPNIENARLALDYIKDVEGVDYELVEVGHYTTPMGLSGVHFNFHAKLKDASSSPEFFLAEVKFGNPKKVVRCVRVIDKPDSHGYSVVHPDNEECVFCISAEECARANTFLI